MATLIAARNSRSRGHEVGRTRDQVLEPMPDADLVRHGGSLEKEAERDGRKHWRSMFCVLTEDILGIRRSEGVAMIDWIPLEEIVSVALAGQEPDMLAAALQEPAKSTRSLWRGGARKSASPLARGASSPASSPVGVCPSPEGAFPAPLIKQQNECEKTTPSGFLATGSHNSICILRITTMAGGRNGGRDYVFRAPSPGLAAEWCQMIRELSRSATNRRNDANRRSLLKKLQLKAKWLHGNSTYRLFFGMLIFASYVLSIAVAEIRPPIGSHLEHQFDVVDTVITSLFAVEVLVALTGFWLRDFFRDPWMVFDLVVVSTSIASAATDGLPALYSLRSIRVFRAVKLLKVGPLRVIVQAMLASVVPVANSFVLLGLIVTIYTTVAVTFFGGRRCAEEQEGRRDNYCEGPGQEPNPYFYKFSAGLLSMFQVMTGDAWATEVMKSTMPEGTLDPTSVLFFVSFMVVGNLVLINIVIAVLLDEFLTTLSRSRDEASRAAGLERSIAESHVLDPMLEVLSQYRSRADLRQSIVALFERMDSDASGYVGFEEMTQMFSKQQLNIYFSQEDWDEICVQHIANQAHNGLSPSEFEKMIMQQLKLYHFRHINRALVGAENTENISLLVLKWMLTREEERDAMRGVASPYALTNTWTPLTPLTSMVHAGSLWPGGRPLQTKKSSPLANGPLSGSSDELGQETTRRHPTRREPLTNTIPLTGVFQKRGHINTAWQQRFFILHKRAISYFTSEDEYENRQPAKGVLLCTGEEECVSIEHPAKDEKGFCFKVVQSTGKELMCKTNSQKQRDTWVREIQAAIQGHYFEDEVGAHVPEEAVEQNQTGPVWTLPVPKRNTVDILQEEKEASPKHRPAGSPLVPSPDWNAKLFLEIETSAVEAPTPVPSWGMPPPEIAVRLDRLEGLLEDMHVKMAQIGSWDAIQESVANLEASNRKLEATVMRNTEQVEKKLDVIFKLLLDKQGTGAQNNRDVERRNRDPVSLVPHIAEDIRKSQAQAPLLPSPSPLLPPLSDAAPLPAAVHFDIRHALAETHAASNNSALGRVITPSGGAVASAGGCAESGEGSGGRGSTNTQLMVMDEVHQRAPEERERRANEHVPSRPSAPDGQQEEEKCNGTQQEEEKCKEEEKRVVSDQHKKISGGVAETAQAQRDADEPLPAVSSVIEVISSSLTPSKPRPDRDAQTHNDMSGIQLHLSSRNAASAPSRTSSTHMSHHQTHVTSSHTSSHTSAPSVRSAAAGSHLFQLPISGKASSSDSAHHPAPVPTTQIPSFNSPVAEQGSFVDVSSEDNSPHQEQDRYDNFVMEGGLLRPKRASADLMSEGASPSLLSRTRLMSEGDSLSAPRPAQFSLIASPSESNSKSSESNSKSSESNSNSKSDLTRS